MPYSLTALSFCRNKGIVYSPPVLMLLRRRRVNQLVTYKRECHGIKKIEIANFITLTFHNIINTIMFSLILRCTPL